MAALTAMRAKGRVAVGGAQLALLDELAQRFLDAAARAIERGLLDVVEQHGVAGLCEDLGDPRAHGAGTDDADGLHDVVHDIRAAGRR